MVATPSLIASALELLFSIAAKEPIVQDFAMEELRSILQECVDLLFVIAMVFAVGMLFAIALLLAAETVRKTAPKFAKAYQSQKGLLSELCFDT